jgi:geranylgeranylglycerol-phosphate geranylgeranyltransferase
MNVFTYIYRGLKYALTSAAAIFAGYLMQADHIVGPDLLVMSIAAVAAWFFFICYANRFDLPSTEEEQTVRIRQILEKNAVTVFLLLVAAWIVIALLLIALRHALPMRLLSSLGIYVALLIYYGVFLLRYRSEGLPLIRHWLVWPVVLSIGIGLYYGLSFSLLKESYLPLLPIGVIAAFYIASNAFDWDRTSFLFRMLLSMLGITTFVVLNLVGIIPIPNTVAAYLSLMFFCIVSSAYLAVFEAWKITANVAEIEDKSAASEPQISTEGDSSSRPSGEPDSTGSRETASDSPLRKTSQYALSTLVALTITIWVLPFYFVFSEYGTLFLLAFALHALIAFIFWFYRGTGKHLKKSRDWMKVWFGVSFLGILVLATFAKQLVPFRFLSGFADWGGWFFAVFLAAFTIPGLIRDVSKQQGRTIRSFALGLLNNRVNFTRILSLLCVLSSFVTIALIRTLDSDLPKRYRAELAFYVYVLCIMFCCLIEAIHYISRRRRMSKAIRTIVGVLLIVRCATSAVISLVVVIPSIHNGIPITSAILSSLPFFLAAAGGFALNDYYDADKDKINKPYRAIPSGRLSSSAVMLLAYALIASAGISTFIIYRTKSQFILYCLSILGVCTYNYLVKHHTLSKNVITALISTLPVVFVIHTLQYPKIYLLLPLSSVTFLLGREWLMDIRDMNGDFGSGIKTLPLRVGPEWTAKISFLSFVVSAALLLPLAFIVQSMWFTTLLVLLALSILVLSIIWPAKRGQYRRSVVLALWVPMSCGILMLLR